MNLLMLLIEIRSQGKTLITEWLERFVNKLFLQVVRLGPIDRITYLKIKEIIFDNKSNVFCRASNGREIV